MDTQKTAYVEITSTMRERFEALLRESNALTEAYQRVEDAKYNVDEQEFFLEFSEDHNIRYDATISKELEEAHEAYEAAATRLMVAAQEAASAWNVINKQKTSHEATSI